MASVRKLSVQLCRVAAAMQVLYKAGEASVDEIYLALVPVLPEPACRRTLRRDLESLVRIGICSKSSVVNFKRGRICVYALAEPSVLNARLSVVQQMNWSERAAAIAETEAKR
jgi:hypothetical protein